MFKANINSNVSPMFDQTIAQITIYTYTFTASHYIIL